MFGGGAGTNKGEIQQVAPQAADDRFSLVELRRIYKQLVENKIVNGENQDLVIEILRVIAEMVVYGDNKSELLFDFFCEKSMLSLFLEIMHSDPVCPVSVHVQILQTLSILISCVKNDTSLYYLLSNNHINDILVFRHDFDSDESLSAQFASFMKTLSLRLNDQTVQFFFREDTGAFPILTKAVELLASKDPMIRISAQSTILNIFRVDEHRALDYALREDNLYVLLECIVGIMQHQFTSLSQFSVAYLQSFTETSLAVNNIDGNPSSTLKIEQHMDDCIISIEDWICYLQDLSDLNIPALQSALATHILNAFIYPILLQSILDIRAKDSTSPELTASQIASTDIAMYYLLQLGRVFPSPSLRRAVITALVHPVSQEARSVLAMHLHQQRLALSGTATDNTNMQPWIQDIVLPEDIALASNLFHQGLQLCLCAEHHQQKIITLTIYALHGVLQALFQDFKNADIGQGALGFESFLIASNFLPYHQFVEKTTGLSNEVWSEGLSGDFLSVSELLVMRRTLLAPSLGISSEPLVQNLLTLVQSPQKYSIANLQAATLLLSYISHVIICAGDITVKETVNVTDEAPGTVIGPTDSGHEEERRYRFTASDRLSVIGTGLQAAVKQATAVLLQRAESSFAEMLLIVLREEIDRFQGRTWKEIHSRMFSEKGLIFPSPQGQPDIMGLDFSIPVSQVECVRKEVQTFLMLRAVLHYLSTSLASFGDGKTSPFEFATFITDCAFLSLEDDSIVPSNLKTGSPFDMKGKKFLDSTVILPAASDNGAGVSGGGSGPGGSASKALSRASSAGAAAVTAAAAASSSSSSSSIFSFGLFGSNKSNANQAAIKAGKDNLQGVTLGQKLLFVQDAHVLQLISASKIDGKSVFKVHIVAPLLYVDGKLDLNNKKRLKLVVRSYKTIVGMQRINIAEDPSSASNTPETLSKGPSGHGSSSGHHHSNAAFRPTVFLKPPRTASMYEIELLMDTEQAASLAIQHVESRRRQLHVLKIEELKKKLSYWLSDRRHWSDCIPNSES